MVTLDVTLNVTFKVTRRSTYIFKIATLIITLDSERADNFT